LRSWKKADTAAGAVFLYFRAHPTTFFTTEHVAAQVKLGQRQVRRIVKALEGLGKVRSVDTVSSSAWGRPKRMFQAVRTTADSLKQLEVFQDAVGASEIYQAFEKRKPA
jgi:hypothetical protein